MGNAIMGVRDEREEGKEWRKKKKKGKPGRNSRERDAKVAHEASGLLKAEQILKKGKENARKRRS